MSDFPPLASLRSFEAVARLGSLTLAAGELHVTHSAVSQQIKQLEALIGVSLFTRHGRGVRLNEQGRLYALHVRDALARIADATRALQVRPRSSELTLALVPSFGCHWLLPRLMHFQARYPHIMLKLTASLTVDDRQSEPFDLAIRMGQGKWPGATSRFLFADELVVVAAAQFNGGNLPQTAQAVASSRIIFSSESWSSWCNAAGLASTLEPHGLCINDSNLVLQAVRLGQGIALERRTLVEDAIARGELVQLTAITAPYPWPYWLVSRQQGEEKPEAYLFSNWLMEQVTLWQQQR